MLRSVWKFAVPIGDAVVISMPQGAEILHVASQDGQPCLWALVEPGAVAEMRRFRFAGTGHPIEEPPLPEKLRHVGSWLQDADRLVFHLFEYASTED